MDGERKLMLVEDETGKKRDHKGLAENQIYTIRIKGHLDHGWSEWLGHVSIKHKEDGTTVLTGQVSDPPAMYGLLIKLRDLGLSLVSVNRGESNPEEPASTAS